MSAPRPRPAQRSSSGDVAAFIEAFDPSRRDAVLALRRVLLAADPRIAEGIKWNAPSFRLADDFATLHLRRADGIGLILHYGAKKSAISETGVDIPDPHRLLEWLGKDRALVVFRDKADIEAKHDALTALVRAWIAHLSAASTGATR